MIPSSARSDAFFRPFRCLLPGYRCRPNVAKVPWQQGVRAFPSTVCVSPNNRLRLRKRPFAYTQKLSSAYFQGHSWGTVGAPFLANIAPKNLFIINKITEKGAHGAMFFHISAYVDTRWHFAVSTITLRAWQERQSSPARVLIVASVITAYQR